MKKALRIFLKIIVLVATLVILAVLIIPVVFKDQIKEKVLSVANEKVNAEIAIDDFSLGLIKNFPNLTFKLKDVSVIGVDEFEGDTLAGLHSFNLVFDLSSLIGKSAYRIKAIEIDRPVAYIKILEDGMANYDIMPEEKDKSMAENIADDDIADGNTEEVKKESKLSFNLKKFEIKNALIVYEDISSDMRASLRDLDLVLSGNMAENQTELLLETNIDGFDFIMGDIKYLNDADLSARFDLGADLENNVFTLKDNRVAINALQLLFAGSVTMTEEDIITDISISTGDTEFKSVLSMVPLFYMKGFEALSTKGSFSLDGDIKGRYNATDSLLPDVKLSLAVRDGHISYPDLPENISGINIECEVIVDGEMIDNTELKLEKFHFELAGNPFDMSMQLKTPVSDPEINADFTGKLNLEALAQAVPMELSEFGGIIDIALRLSGKMSMIENEDFEAFDAAGSLALSDFAIEMDGVPPVGIETVRFEFSPQYAALEEMKLNIAGNNISVNGKLENYLPYIFDDKIVVGRLSLYSPRIDLDTIMSYMPVDTTRSVVNEDTVSIALIRLPENIDFEFDASIENFIFNPLVASALKGNIILRDGILIIQETGLETLNGQITIDAKYDSRDTLNPKIEGSLAVSDLGIEAAFTTFNTVKKLAPVAEGMDGDISVEFDFAGILGEGMMPVLESINGRGQLVSEEIKLVSSPVYEKLNALMSFGEGFSNTFKDVDVEFSVRDGRVYIDPFDTRLGDMKINISGDHGLDQTINYLMKAEIASDKLPGSMKIIITGLKAQAALLGIKYEQEETIKMNIIIEGSVKDPVIKPSLVRGDGKSTVKEAAKEAVKEVVDKKVEEVKEKISDEIDTQTENLITEAQKKADMVVNEASVAAQKIRLEADNSAQKLIDEAANKGALARIAANKGAEALRKTADKKAKQLEDEAKVQAGNIMTAARKKAEEAGKK